MKNIAITFASLFIMTGVISNKVHADSSRLELSMIDIELAAEEQKLIKGTESQMSKVNEKSMSFIKSIALDAHLNGNEYGIYPSIIISQAVLESSIGESDLANAPYNNLFGMKGSYDGESTQMFTNEDDGSGKIYTIYANFKKYPDRGESLKDHSKLLREGLNGYYSGTWRENAKTPKEAAEYLQGRYATDTRYAEKLMSIINNYNLERFDETLTERDLVWLISDSLDPWELPVVKEVSIESNDNTSKQMWNYSTNIISNERQNVDEYMNDYFGVERSIFNVKRQEYKVNIEDDSITTYKVKNNDDGLVEKYAIIESLKNGYLLFSEGNSELYEIYRSKPENYYYKSKLIDIENLSEYLEDNSVGD